MNESEISLRKMRTAQNLLLFESSHRIKALLAQLAQIFVGRQCVIAKELTKLHEQFLYGEAEELLALLNRDNALTRGEFVVLIDNSIDSFVFSQVEYSAGQ